MTEPLLAPGTALLAGTLLLAVAIVFFWPGLGLIARWSRNRQNSQRVTIENALKHLYDSEYKRTTATLQSLAGALGTSADQAARLSARLEGLGLLKPQQDVLVLTVEGRSYALRVIRMHRLWERYLADETGLDEMEWHKEADEKEHLLTPHEAEELSARMGHPRFDPHGDPIPTASGDLPTPRGKTLTSLAVGEVAEIVHVEDEPKTVYAQIVALGLYPGMQVRMVESSHQRLRFVADSEECVLAPMFAGNVTVIPVLEESRLPERRRTLASLGKGEEATVTEISKACRGQQRRRLMDMGIIPGTAIRAELQSMGGDPTAYVVRGALVALRKRQAEQIYVREKGEGRP
jgi:DtxR family Mn-dependent transcriptional regulator